ncbi:hypothetical protein MMC20_001308 [Loxospora ochrophaea]|nr:hypothetical protein [Loxospora ochrophaea]
MALDTSAQRHTVNSPDNHGPLINIIAWLAIVISVLAVLARMGTKWFVQHKVDWDDGAIAAALIAAVAQTIAISSAASNGLGKHVQDLNVSQIDGFQKVQTSSCLLNRYL